VTRVTVVIPAYNASAYLGQSVDSVRAQRRPVDEIIVVDDCSSDDTCAVAIAHGARSVSTGRNGGPGRARNVGIQAATGDVIAFLDADDWWAPDHTEVVAGLLERFPDASVAFSGARSFGMQEIEYKPPVPEQESLDLFWTLVNGNIIPQLATAARREALLAAGGYEESMRWAEDYDLWLRLARRHRFVCSHRLTAHYRSHYGQTTTQNPTSLIHGTCLARHRLFELIQREDPELTGQLASAMREAWERSLKRAWRNRDRQALEFGLSLSGLVPGSAPIRHRWQLRSRLAWPAWAALGHLWDAMPRSARTVLRQPLHRLTGLE
jgi:cellulose synthase/poly-beta-1,6-N-acetylglucosamine synthase-like glycosyltransferase